MRRFLVFFLIVCFLFIPHISFSNVKEESVLTEKEDCSFFTDYVNNHLFDVDEFSNLFTSYHGSVYLGLVDEYREENIKNSLIFVFVDNQDSQNIRKDVSPEYLSYLEGRMIGKYVKKVLFIFLWVDYTGDGKVIRTISNLENGFKVSCRQSELIVHERNPRYFANLVFQEVPDKILILKER